MHPATPRSSLTKQQMSSLLAHQNLPWTNVRSEQSLFRATLAVVLVLFVSFALVVSFYDVPEPDRESLEALPPQLAKILKESKAKKEELKKPKEIPVEKKPKVEAPKPKVPPTVAPKPKPAPKESVRKQKDLKETQKSTAKQIEQARAVAKQSGILAMQSEMQALASSVSSSAFASETSAKKQASASTEATKVATVDQSALAVSSSGKAAAEQSSGSEGIALDSKGAEILEVTQDEVALAKAEREASDTRKQEDIQIVVEGLRSTFNLLYNRALRDDPFLEGKLILAVRIEANGSVSNVDVVENTLDNEPFVNKLITRMKLTNFGASGTKATTQILPFEFTPS